VCVWSDWQVIAGALHTIRPTARRQLTTAANTSCTGCRCPDKTPTITYVAHSTMLSHFSHSAAYFWATFWVGLDGRFDGHRSNHSECGLSFLRTKNDSVLSIIADCYNAERSNLWVQITSSSFKAPKPADLQ